MKHYRFLAELSVKIDRGSVDRSTIFLILTMFPSCLFDRMHLRAHGTVTKFFAEIRDAPANPSLALCASTVLFVLSQDRLNMDLDRESLELMLNLLDTDSRIKDALDGAGMNKRELEKNKQKVRILCDSYWVLEISCMDFKS